MRYILTLLRGLAIDSPMQVWATDITYMPLPLGVMYLTAVIGLYSRYVLSWSLSNTMEAEWCRQMIQGAVDQHGKPEILNTDQSLPCILVGGAQYTSDVFSHYVVGQGIKLSMDDEGTIPKGECLGDIQVSEPRSGWVAVLPITHLSNAYGGW